MDIVIANPAGAPVLTINADDFGACTARDDGILRLFAQGHLDSATLLVNGASTMTAARAARALGLPLGLHLNLTEGRPIARGASSLTDAAGSLRGKYGLRAALAAGVVNAGDLAREIRAQLAQFVQLTGRLPTHVDGHHHIQVEAEIARSLAPILDEEYGVNIVRLPVGGDAAEAAEARPDGRDRRGAAPAVGVDATGDADFYAAVATRAAQAAAVYAAHGLRWADGFLGLHLMGEALTAAAVGRELSALRARGVGRVELMVHPGDVAGPGEGNAFSRDPARAHEARELASSGFASAIAGWRRASFADFPAPPDAAGRPTVLIAGKLTPATGNAETVHRMRAALAPVARTVVRPLLADPEDAAALARDATDLAQQAAREGAELALGVHVYRAGTLFAAAFPAAHGDRGDVAAALPFGLFASGTDANDDIGKPARRQTMAAALAQADFLLCLTDDLRARLSTLPLPADTRVCANGISVATESRYSLRAALGLRDEQPMVLLPAAIRPVKGVLPLLDGLLPALAGRHRDHVLVIVGPTLDDDYRAQVDARIAQALQSWPQLAGRIVLHDGLPHADYLAALREAQLVINHSTSEGQSHVLLEAMAAGVPVLASDIPGNRSIVAHGQTGRLFADPDGLRREYAACFDDPATTGRLVAAARAWVDANFSAQAEQTTLRDTVQAALARAAQPVVLPGGAALRLQMGKATHRVDPANLPLLAALQPSPGLLARLRGGSGLAVDVGCGSGVFGIHLLDLLARAGVVLDTCWFIDIDDASLTALQRTLRRDGARVGGSAHWRLTRGSLLRPLLDAGRRAELICANLPQTPFPDGAARRADRDGGRDGAELLCALLRQLPTALADGGEAWLLHDGLANPRRVEQTAGAAGLQLATVAEVPRRVALADYTQLAPGLPDLLRARHDAGDCEFDEARGEIGFTARLLRATRG